MPEAGRAWTRRQALAGLTAGLALPLAAPAVLRAEADVEPLAAILARSGLGTDTGLVVADAASGAVLEAHQPDRARPPASVVKILTALYALDVLGGGYRFGTRLVATGALEGGRIAGDLALVGGGDPVLDTDALGDLAAQLAAAGVRDAAGRFLVVHGALPSLAVIEPDQPLHAGYNPAIAGINLNFNRVLLEWEPGGEGASFTLSAPGAHHAARVGSIRAEIGGAGGISHRIAGGAEVWRLPAVLAQGRGSMWLPVRRPPLYAGEVFASLAAGMGITLAPPEPVLAAPRGEVLAERLSQPLEALLRGMLRHSTNLTAEVAGLAATRAAAGRVDDLSASALAMGEWARARYGLLRSLFVNHSGLTVRSRTTAADTVRVLVAAEREGLGGLLAERPILDDRGDVARGLDVEVRAKTGTMHFLRGYAGYLEGPRRRLAFAIFAADLAAREAVRAEALEAPPGARTWLARARAQENALLRRWARLHAA